MRAKLIFATFTLASVVLCTSAFSQTALQLFHRMQAALGGADRIAAIRDFELTTWLADRDARFRITSPTKNVVRISDGDVTHQLDITLDPVSSLPAKTTSISLADPARPVSS